jgi:oxalate decarboxylase
LADDKAAIGWQKLQSPVQYTFKMEAMAPTKRTTGGEIRIVDSHNFPASKNVAVAMNTIRPGGMRELHWHPNASEWQFWMAGKGRMTVFMPVGSARTMDFNANDVGFVPANAGHYVENTGDSDLVFLEMFKANEVLDVSLNQWIRRLPPEMVYSHLKLDRNAIQTIPSEKLEILPR